VEQRNSLWEGNPMLALVAAFGTVVGAGLVALYQRVTQSGDSVWQMAAVADAPPDLPTGQYEKKKEEHLPPLAEKEPFRPDLFQSKDKGQVLLSDVKYDRKRNYWFPRSYNGTDVVFIATMLVLHGAAFILGPMTFSYECLALAFGMYVVTGLFGITLSFHRQLSHRSFQTPKWLEYIFAYCGILAIQGDPIEWVSSHRHHHKYCETDRDPHTPFEGLWWSHMGWLLDHTASKSRTADQTNAPDMTNDPFYRWIQKTYPIHILLSAAAFYAWGGLPYLVWGVAVRAVWVYHITWLVNSASHVWGYKTYKTPTNDESRNNWWVGVLAFGEGWHNNHHAFQNSARHGLEWYQWDPTWWVIRSLQFLGLAKNVKLPTEARKEAMRLAPA
jgi:stearoyl-CoA desaturase (delta-9 desaturase)